MPKDILLVRYRSLIFILTLVVFSIGILSIKQLNVFGMQIGSDSRSSLLGLTLGLDLEGGTHLVYEVIPEDGREPTEEDMEGVRRIINQRVNEFGVSEAKVQLLGGTDGTVSDRVLVQIPGQSGANITLKFKSNTQTKSDVESFFIDNFGRNDITISENDDGSFRLGFDSISPATFDSEGNIVTKSEADIWSDKIIEVFPVNIQVGFKIDTAENSSESSIPKLNDVTKAFDDLGRNDVIISQLNENDPYFNIDFSGLDIKTTDSSGKPIQNEPQIIFSSLSELGEIEFFDIQGYLEQWTVGGGVQEAKNLIGKTAQLEFRYRECGDLTAPDKEVIWPPDGLSEEQWNNERCVNPKYFIESDTEIMASDLENAFPDVSTQSGISKPIVSLVFNDDGADAFYEATDRISRHNDRLAIYLDDEELVAPSATTGISGGRAIIEGGSFTNERVRTIAIQLRSGALPVGLELIQERNVDASLGKDSLEKSLLAGIIGLFLLMLFLILYFKIPGIVASITLIIYTILLLATFKILSVTLTLSGAAAIILSLGFAVDANVLIAERTKEEIRSGKSILSAITSGFDRAWPSIRDGNFSTIIVAVVLYWFGDRFSTTVMQGFALTLTIGVLLSMFTAFFTSRVILRLLANRNFISKSSLFTPVGIKSEKGN
ncbi:MAG: protein translocase subunit SecD [Chloroflexi bacterium]|nr:protein translocase subunit SecD [Chloroflexota bacterium]